MFSFFKSKAKPQTPAEPAVEAESVAESKAELEPEAAVQAEAEIAPSEDAVTPEKEPEQPPAKSLSWAARLKQGLSRTREQLGKQLSSVFGRHVKIDDELYEELETILLSADVGIDATTFLLEDLRKRVKRTDSGLRNRLIQDKAFGCSDRLVQNKTFRR